MQDFLSESCYTGRSYELQIPGTLKGPTWAKWALPLSLFAGLTRQSASLWIVVLWYEHNISPLPSATAAPRLWLMRLMTASLLVLPLSVSLVLLKDCLKIDAVVLIVAELVAIGAIYAAEVPPRRLQATPRPVIPLDELKLERARISA